MKSNNVMRILCFILVIGIPVFIFIWSPVIESPEVFARVSMVNHTLPIIWFIFVLVLTALNKWKADYLWIYVLFPFVFKVYLIPYMWF